MARQCRGPSLAGRSGPGQSGVMIIGTAGHIDHGKTALVRALTGVDADRLEEEKRRGITIDLGYAYAGALGFIDVPGHERFVHTMLAGASGIDAALLAVAADDGVMPQTREHAAILGLLGIERGVVAITKADLGARPGRFRRRRGPGAPSGHRPRRCAHPAGFLPYGGGHRGIAGGAGGYRSTPSRPGGVPAPRRGSRVHADGCRADRDRHPGRGRDPCRRPAGAVAARPRPPGARPACAEPARRGKPRQGSVSR